MFRLIYLSVLLLFLPLFSTSCGGVYVAQSREAVRFGDVAGPAKDWVAACQNELIPSFGLRSELAANLWSKVNKKVALEESAFLCNLYGQQKFDIVSVEELMPPYCISPVCVFIKRRSDNWWGMLTVQIAKNFQDDRVPPYSEGNVVVAVQYGTQQANCRKDLQTDVFSQCFWQAPLVTPTPTPTVTRKPQVTPTP